MKPLSIRIAEFRDALRDPKYTAFREALLAWSEAALKIETALHDARHQAAARKVEADDLRRQRDDLRGDASRGGEA